MIRIFSTLMIFFILAACTQNSKAKKHFFGEVDADEIDVASRLPGRIVSVRVRVGQKVKSGDVLIEFEDDILSVKKRRAVATIAAAESQRDIADDAVRPEEKEQLAAAVAAAKKQRDFAKVSLERSKALLTDGAISKQQYDEVEFKFVASDEQYKATLAKAKLGEQGARVEQKEGAEAVVEQARTGLEEVEAYQKDLLLATPIDAEISQVLSKEGELVPQGYPVVTLLRLASPWVNLQIPESELFRFPMGKEFKISVPALADAKLDGEVSFIAPMASFATKVYTQDRSSFDLKTFEVRVVIHSAPENLRPGMTAEIMVEP